MGFAEVLSFLWNKRPVPMFQCLIFESPGYRALFWAGFWWQRGPDSCWGEAAAGQWNLGSIRGCVLVCAYVFIFFQVWILDFGGGTEGCLMGFLKAFYNLDSLSCCLSMPWFSGVDPVLPLPWHLPERSWCSSWTETEVVALFFVFLSNLY